jgi:hypothetical protein
MAYKFYVVVARRTKKVGFRKNPLSASAGSCDVQIRVKVHARQDVPSQTTSPSSKAVALPALPTRLTSLVCGPILKLELNFE